MLHGIPNLLGRSKITLIEHLVGLRGREREVERGTHTEREREIETDKRARTKAGVPVYVLFLNGDAASLTAMDLSSPPLSMLPGFHARIVFSSSSSAR